jgi:hypothetical protein
MFPIRLAIGGAVVAGSILVLGAHAGAIPLPAHHPVATADCHRLHVGATDYPQGSHVKAVVDGQTPIDTFFGGTFSQDVPWSTTMVHHWAVTITSSDDFPIFDQHGDAGPCETLTVATVANPTTTTLPWVDCHANPPATADVAEHCPPAPTTEAATTTTAAVTGDVVSVPTVSTTPPCQEDEPCWDCATMGNHVCGSVTPRAPTMLPATGPGDIETILGVGAGLLIIGSLLLLTRLARRARADG